MPRVVPDLKRRTVTLETQRRSIDIPTDALGHLRRANVLAPQFRAANADGTIPFAGDFMPFGGVSWIGSKRWGFWETYERGCIAKTIAEKTGANNDITFNRDHDNRLLLARTSNGTLRLSEGETHGHAEAEMGDYTYARDAAAAIARRDLTGMSFAFQMITYEWSVADDGNDLLTHREMELYDVATVGMPANIDTDGWLRMDMLSVARDAGFDAVSFDELAQRLADPNPSLIAALRDISRSDPDNPDAPGRSTRLAEALASEPPPASTTESANPLVLRHLAARTELIKEII